MTDFKSLLENYRVIFFDAYGVIKNYKGLIPGIGRTFDWLNEQQKSYYIITNDASRSPDLLAASYHKNGLLHITPDKIISSGMLAKEFLDLKVKKGLVAYLGTEDSAHYIEHPGLDTLPIQQMNEDNINDITALVLLDDEGFDWQPDINRAINVLRHRTIPVVVANADKTYPVHGNDVAVAVGGIADLIESILEKRFVRFGKPDAYMFSYSFARASAISPGVRRKDILMVGDTLETDIRGGNKFGIDTVLVLSGNTAKDTHELMIQASGVIPDFICDSIAT